MKRPSIAATRSKPSNLTATTIEDKIDHTKNGAQNQSFAYRFVTGQKKTKSDYNCNPNSA